MELKLSSSSLVRSLFECSNRTFMELKSLKTPSIRFRVLSSNRTFMELKLRLIGLSGAAGFMF